MDDHYYVRATQNFARRDALRQGRPQWAEDFRGRVGHARRQRRRPTMGAALGDAAWMTGMERNSDLIVMACYAPLLVNVNPGGMQWETDLIGYNAMKSYGSPRYYAQVMFASYLGDHTVQSKLENGGAKFFYSVTMNTAKKQLYLKLVNASSDAQPVADCYAWRASGSECEAGQAERARYAGDQQHRRSESAGAGGNRGA